MVKLSIQDIKDMKGTYSIKLGSIKKHMRITDESIVIFNRVKSDICEDIKEVKEQEIFISKQWTGFGEKSFFFSLFEQILNNDSYPVNRLS